MGRYGRDGPARGPRPNARASIHALFSDLTYDSLHEAYDYDYNNIDGTREFYS